MTNDQEHYKQLIEELDSFTKRLHELREKCDVMTNENDCLRIAIDNARACIVNLNRAQIIHVENEKRILSDLFDRIRSGTTRQTDANLAKRFMS